MLCITPTIGLCSTRPTDRLGFDKAPGLGYPEDRWVAPVTITTTPQDSTRGMSIVAIERMPSAPSHGGCLSMANLPCA